MYKEVFAHERARMSESETQGSQCPRCGKSLQMRFTGGSEVLLCVRCGFCYEYQPRQLILGGG